MISRAFHMHFLSSGHEVWMTDVSQAGQPWKGMGDFNKPAEVPLQAVCESGKGTGAPTCSLSHGEG